MKDDFATADPLSRVLIASAVDGILVVDAEGLIRIFNPACERLFGYASDEVVGKNVMMLVPAMGRVDLGDHIALFSESGRPIVGNGREAVGLRRNRSTFPMCVSVGSGALEAGNIFVCIVHSLTNHNLDDSVREREKRLNSILEVVPDAVVIVDEAGTVNWFSAAASTLFGYKADDVVGKNVSMLIPSPYRGSAGRAPDAPPGGAIAVEKGRVVIGRRSDGSKFPMEIAIGEIFGGPKRLFTSFLRDLTKSQGSEQRIVDLQAELLHVSRLSSMGQMSAAIAHELNQPLTAILNYIKAAKRTLLFAGANQLGVARALSNIDKAAAQTLRAGQIIKNLREFVEKRARNRRPEDVAKVFEEAIALAFVGASEKKIKVELEVDADLAAVMIDKIQIQQVLVNLVRNSIEAMQACDKRELHLTASAGEAGFIDVTVHDTGPGMPGRVSQRLFQPFVTTKDSGMGIGLSICQSIVEAHGGRIWLLESNAAGTGFRFQLPLWRVEQEAA